MDAIPLPQPAPFRPWLTMWLHPRQTIQKIVDTNPLRGIYLLIVLSGIASGVGGWTNAVTTDTDTFEQIFLLSVGYNFVSQTAALLASALVMQWIVSRSGSIIPYSHLVAANFWGMVPNIGYLLLFVVVYAGTVIASTLVPLPGGVLTALDLLLPLAWAVAAIWTFVLVIGALAQVMRCSNGSALGRQIVASLIVFPAMWALSRLFFYLLSDNTGGDRVIYQAPGTETAANLNDLLIPLLILVVAASVLYAMRRSVRARQAEARPASASEGPG